VIAEIRDDQAPVRPQQRVQPADDGVPVDGGAEKAMDQEDGRGRRRWVTVAAVEEGDRGEVKEGSVVA
jgi:hypothetical protein